jgi:hypothetical protein
MVQKAQQIPQQLHQVERGWRRRLGRHFIEQARQLGLQVGELLLQQGNAFER